MAGSDRDRISAARTAALSPRSRPTAATGIPGGICTMERMASIFRAPLTGTPMTGFVVKEATTPGRAAERPAIVMKTPASLAVTISSTRCGVRCADATAMSNGIPNFFSIPMAFSATGMSLLLPIIMETLVIATRTDGADKNFGDKK